VTDLYAEADKVISLSKTNSGNNGLGKRAGPERGAPRSQQRDNGFKARPYDGATQSRKRETFAKKRPDEKDVVCNKCHNKGHIAANCKSVYTKDGKFIGRGEPPANHYWTKQHAKEAENLKQKKAAMVKKTAHRHSRPSSRRGRRLFKP
jgi:ssDNA-binding Zn-finger/Zn-ribbon topoisomerase 1